MKYNPGEAPATNWQEIIVAPNDTEQRGKQEIAHRKRLDTIVQTAGDVLFGGNETIDADADQIYIKADQISYRDPTKTYHEVLLDLISQDGDNAEVNSEALHAFEITAIIDEMRRYDNPSVRDVVGLQKSIEFQRDHIRVFKLDSEAENPLKIQEGFLNSYAEYDSKCSAKKMQSMPFTAYLAAQRRVYNRRKIYQDFLHRGVDPHLQETLDALDSATATLDEVHKNYDNIARMLLRNS